MVKINEQNQALENSLVVVSAKEHGKIFHIKNGEINILEYFEEHPLKYSDNEGFFFRSGNGINLGSGNVREEDDEQNIKRYVKGIATELSSVIKKINPSTLYLFEPEYLKGLIEKHVAKPNDLEIKTVSYGNYVKSDLEQIVKMLIEFVNKDSLDAGDPESVAGEKNAEEKRKILEVGKMFDDN